MVLNKCINFSTSTYNLTNIFTIVYKMSISKFILKFHRVCIPTYLTSMLITKNV